LPHPRPTFLAKTEQAVAKARAAGAYDEAVEPVGPVLRAMSNAEFTSRHISSGYKLYPLVSTCIRTKLLVLDTCIRPHASWCKRGLSYEIEIRD